LTGKLPSAIYFIARHYAQFLQLHEEEKERRKKEENKINILFIKKNDYRENIKRKEN
jgi:hypothetical protein